MGTTGSTNSFSKDRLVSNITLKVMRVEGVPIFHTFLSYKFWCPVIGSSR